MIAPPPEGHAKRIVEAAYPLVRRFVNEHLPIPNAVFETFWTATAEEYARSIERGAFATLSDESAAENLAAIVPDQIFTYLSGACQVFLRLMDDVMQQRGAIDHSFITERFYLHAEGVNLRGARAAALQIALQEMARSADSQSPKIRERMFFALTPAEGRHPVAEAEVERKKTSGEHGIILDLNDSVAFIRGAEGNSPKIERKLLGPERARLLAMILSANGRYRNAKSLITTVTERNVANVHQNMRRLKSELGKAERFIVTHKRKGYCASGLFLDYFVVPAELEVGEVFAPETE